MKTAVDNAIIKTQRPMAIGEVARIKDRENEIINEKVKIKVIYK